MNDNTLHGAAGIGFTLSLLASLPLQSQDDPSVPIFLDRVTVNLVNVEVMVTDKKRPVMGLTREDFDVYDDGEKVDITNFYFVENGYRNEELAGIAPEDPGAGVGLMQERSFVVVLVDNTFIAPAQRKQVFSALHERLDSLFFEGSQVMVVNKDRTVRIEQRFTGDREEVEVALDRIAEKAGTASNSAAGERMVLRQIEIGTIPNINLESAAAFAQGDPALADAQMTMNEAAAHASEVAQNVRRSTLAIRAFLNSLAGLPGRKAVLYVADGLPLQAGELVFNAWFQKYRVYSDEVGVFSAQEAVQEFDSTQELVDLIADASANRVAFYPIASGLSPSLSAISARSDSTIVTASFAGQNQSPLTQGLRLLARGTGGFAATEVANFDRLLDQLEQDLTGYYSLGFSSRHNGDGKVHKIRVLVKRPGVQVRYLDTYRDKNPDQRMNDRTLSSLLMESGANPLGAWVELGEAEEEKGGRYLLPVEVKFPISSLALVPESKSHRGSVSVFVIVRDDQGRLSQPQKVPLPVSIPNENILAAMSQAAAYATKIRLRKGEHTLGIGVRDDFANIGSTLNVKLNVGEAR